MKRVALFLVGLVWAVTSFAIMAARDTFPVTDLMSGEGGNAEYSPLHDTYQLWGWDILRYYYFLYAHHFAEYPWVVRVAYMVIIVCCLAFVVLFVAMCVNVYLRRRNYKRLNRIREKYLEPLKDVCYAEVENLPMDEIKRRIGYEERKWKKWEMQLWSQVFIEVSVFTNTMNPNLTNIQRAMRLVGFTDYVERQLIYGKNCDKVRLLQTVRLTNMRLPNSIVARLVNDKSLPLRKAARLYYMVASKENPYDYFEEDTERVPVFTTWDKMELHEIFSRINKANRPTPRFVPILQKMKNPDFCAFLMRETAWWGTDNEVRYLIGYFDDDNFTMRKAAFTSMGIRKFSEAEKAMQDEFYKQTESLRRTILRSCLAIGSERNVPFFVEAYNSSTADYTRRTALRCLWASGAEGHAAFRRLMEKANAEDKILFEHVECELINHDGL